MESAFGGGATLYVEGLDGGEGLVSTAEFSRNGGVVYGDCDDKLGW